MSRVQEETLELISVRPEGAARPTPLLFVHGAYAGAWCWAEHFLPWFAAHGYEAHALSLSGHGTSHGRRQLDTFSIGDYVRDVERIVARLPMPPVLIGHSMGGLVLQKYLERRPAPGVVLMCSVPPQGLWASALSLALRKPGLLLDLNRILGGARPDPVSLKGALFHQPVDDERLARYYQHMQPESHRAIWDMTLFDLPHPSRMYKPPMLILGAEHDLMIPPSQVELTGHAYQLPVEILSGMGHGVMLEQDWERPAARVLAWLQQQGY